MYIHCLFQVIKRLINFYNYCYPFNGNKICRNFIKITIQAWIHFSNSTKKITETCEIEENLMDKIKIKEKFDDYFCNDGNGLIDSIRTTLDRFINYQSSKEQLVILSLFLSIGIGWSHLKTN